MTAATGARNDARRRAREAFQLRCAHHTWDAIAEAKGYGSPAAAHKAVTRHIARMPPEELAMARALAAGTYSMVIASLVRVAVKAEQAGKYTNVIEAQRAIADVQERHCKLTGVQAEVAPQINVTVAPVVALEQAEQAMIAHLERQPQLPQAPAAQPDIIEAEVIE